MTRKRGDEAPSEPDPDGTGGAGAAPTGAAETDRAATDTFETDPVETDPVETDPIETDPIEAARAIALRSLAGAPRTRAQLAEKLADKGVADDVAETLLDRLSAVGLIDDAELAGQLVRTRHAERNLGRRAIAVELRRKGIDDDLAARALDQLGDDDEEEAALAVARSKLRSTRSLAHEVRYRRTIAALGRKGFSGELSRRAMRTALAEEDVDLDELDPSGD